MNDKIQILLAQAEREHTSSDAEKSSVSHAARRFENRAETEKAFSYLRDKLLKIEFWNETARIMNFRLFDADGKPRREKARAEDYIEIIMPGSGKSDWVKIIEIYEAENETVLTVQPSSNPTVKQTDQKATSHFFTDDSTNNFCLKKSTDSIDFYVIGLSEKANTEQAKNLLESVRNYAVANVGHFLGIQTNEWQKFCENFLESEKANE